MSKLTINQKLVSVCVIMPLLADLLEDLIENTDLRKDLFDKHLA